MDGRIRRAVRVRVALHLGYLGNGRLGEYVGHRYYVFDRYVAL